MPTEPSREKNIPDASWLIENKYESLSILGLIRWAILKKFSGDILLLKSFTSWGLE